MLQKELNTKREGPPRGTAEGSRGPQARLKEPKMRIFIYPQRSVIGFFTWVPGRPLSLVTQINVLQSCTGTCELQLSPQHLAVHPTGPGSICHHNPAPVVPEHCGALSSLSNAFSSN